MSEEKIELQGCECEKWQRILPILSGQQVIASTKSYTKSYPQDGMFIYCPWCGEKRKEMSDNLPEGYSREMPTREGAYWMTCNETDYERSPVEIRLEKGQLIADDVELGVQPLEYFHNGLTDIAWKRAMNEN